MSANEKFGLPFYVDQLEFWFKVIGYMKEGKLEQRFECSYPMDLDEWNALIEAIYNGHLPGLGVGEYTLRIPKKGQTRIFYDEDTPAPKLSHPLSLIRRHLHYEDEHLRNITANYPSADDLRSFVQNALRFAFLDYLQRSVWSPHRIEPLFVDVESSHEIEDDHRIRHAPDLIWGVGVSTSCKLTLRRRRDGGISIVSVMLSGCKSKKVIQAVLCEQIRALITQLEQNALSEVSSISQQKIELQQRIIQELF